MSLSVSLCSLFLSRDERGQICSSPSGRGRETWGWQDEEACYFESICSCYISRILRLPGNSMDNVGLTSLFFPPPFFFFLSGYVPERFLQLQLIVFKMVARKYDL